MKNLQNNSKKLSKGELKNINGGNTPEIPIGCDRWDFRARCCKEWDWENQGRPTC